MRSIFVVLISVLLISTSAGAEQTRVGAILPLSGAFASWGARVRVGLETANELLGNRFAITFEDEGACESQKALTAYRKLSGIDQVKIIFLGCLSGSEAIAPVAKRDSVLLLSLGLLNQSTLSAGAKLVDLATEVGVEAEYLARYVSQEKPRRIAGIFVSDGFGQEFSRVLSQNIPFIAKDDADANIQSFKSLIARWKHLNVDVLVTTLAGKQQLTLAREMRELKFSPKLFSSYIVECYAPSKADRVFYEGIRYTHPVNSADENSVKKHVEDALLKREAPGQSSNINALFAYDGLGFLLQGLERCSGVVPDCLFNYFVSLGRQTGVSGEMEFKTTGALTRPYGLKRVTKGEFEWLEKSAL